MPSNHNGRITGTRLTPEDIVADALKYRCKTIAYTYNEPTVFFELAFDTAKLAHKSGLKNVFVTNGYMTTEALEKISPFLDAANVDLKAFNDEFYKKYCSAKRSPVMDTLKRMKTLGVFVEVTTLLIPGLNDDPGELNDLAAFIVEDLGDDTPWHVSRFHPTYRLTDRPPTPVDTLLNARKIGMKAGLKYVYTGNVPGEASENTYCSKCNSILINRRGFSVMQNSIENNRCRSCGAAVHGVGLSM